MRPGGRKQFFLTPNEVELIRAALTFLHGELSDSLCTRAQHVSRTVTQRQMNELLKRFNPLVLSEPVAQPAKKKAA